MRNTIFPHKFWRLFLDCMPQLFFKPQFVWFPAHLLGHVIPNSSGQLTELNVYIIQPEQICIVTRSYWIQHTRLITTCMIRLSCQSQYQHDLYSYVVRETRHYSCCHVSISAKYGCQSLARFFNPQCAGTELSRFNQVNIMVADALAPCVARASATMIFTV